MDLDFKETCWYRVNIIPGKEQEALKFLKEGKCQYPSDIVNAGLADYDNIVTDTSDQMTVSENGNYSTIETVDSPEFWDNTMLPNAIEPTHIKCHKCGEMTLNHEDVSICLHCLTTL